MSHYPPGVGPGYHGPVDPRPRTGDPAGWVVHPRTQRARLRTWRGFAGAVGVTFALVTAGVYLVAGRVTVAVLVGAALAVLGLLVAARAQVWLSRLERRYDFDTPTDEPR